MEVSVTLPLLSTRVIDLGGECLCAGFVVAKRGEGCLVTRGTLSYDWLRVLKCSTGAELSGECKEG